tara:strand:+ start:10399 stop:10887 length:489 start_codon:yes stop_codon:yes gene_type:complete
MSLPNSLCRCGTGKTYAQCCEPYLRRKSHPQTAEQLMRSRFSAFCMNNFQYLNDSHHPAKRSALSPVQLKQKSSQTNWISLRIIDTENGQPEQDIGLVEFAACFEEEGRYYELREKSNFLKGDGRWFYLDGDTQVNAIALKFSRNESCWCQTGKKYKHCHGA